MGIILGVAFVVVNWQSLFSKTAKTNTPEINTKDTASKIIDWLNTNRTNEGLYPFGCPCAGDQNQCQFCKMSIPSQREGPFIVWGRYKFYKAFGGEDNLTKINQELTTLAKLPLQFDDWNCRILLDLYQDPKLSAETKQKVAATCANDGRTSVDLRFIKDFKEYLVDHGDIAVNVEQIMSGKVIKVDENLYDKNLLKYNFKKDVFQSSENIAKITILGKEKNKVEPKINFQYALMGYSLLNAEGSSVYSNSILGIASLDMYKYYKDAVYFNLAQYLYQQNEKLTAKTTFPDVVYQTLFLQNLAKESGQNKYSNEVKSKITVLVKNLFNANAKAMVTDQVVSSKQNALLLGIILNN